MAYQADAGDLACRDFHHFPPIPFAVNWATGKSIHPGLLEAGNSINRGELFVTLLLKLSQLIDWLNERVGKGAFWLVPDHGRDQRRQRQLSLRIQ